MILSPAAYGVLAVLKNYAKRWLAGRKRLQKMVCIIQYEKKYPLFNFHFIKHYYGPYSFDLKTLIDRLVFYGYVEEQFDGLQYLYRITPKGLEALEKSPSLLRHSLEEIAQYVRLKLARLSTPQLVELSKKLFGW